MNIDWGKHFARIGRGALTVFQGALTILASFLAVLLLWPAVKSFNAGTAGAWAQLVLGGLIGCYLIGLFYDVLENLGRD